MLRGERKTIALHCGGHCSFQLLLVRVRLLFSSTKVDESIPKDTKLIEAILHEKLSFLSREQNELSLAEQHYHQAVKAYQHLVHSEKEKAKDDQFSVLSFALIFNLCNEHHYPLPELEEKFNDVLQKDKARARKHPDVPSSSDDLAQLIRMLREQSKSSSAPVSSMSFDRILLRLLISFWRSIGASDDLLPE